MQSNSGPDERINEYALVSYVPGSLGEFLNELRRQLVPDSVAKSHVTVLPPRELRLPEEQASLVLERELSDAAPFTIELNGVDCFSNTSVIYIAVSRGWKELVALHARLNQEGLKFAEPYDYHPHVTLAQDFPPAEIGRKLDIARDRWSRFTQSRSFEVDHLTFVQNTVGKRWRDLRNLPLNAVLV